MSLVANFIGLLENKFSSRIVSQSSSDFRRVKVSQNNSKLEVQVLDEKGKSVCQINFDEQRSTGTEKEMAFKKLCFATKEIQKLECPIILTK